MALRGAINTRYKRLAAAFVAAVGLHAGLLWWLSGREIQAPGDAQAVAALPVEIVRAKPLPQQPKAEIQPSSPPASQHAKPPIRVWDATLEAKRQGAAPSSPKRAAKRPASSSQPSSRQDRLLAKAKVPTKAASSPAAQAAVADSASRPVPKGKRSVFLAWIRYPWIARRMGWEGRVEVGFEVRARRPLDVRLLASSGHRILDEAAVNGVRRVARVDLTDGRYRLPVRFVLR